ncbi:MAG: DUF167 domain-containing protein [Acidobacteria bacterium]|nr:DUF167 domain-containing protein [Acidobacteriota bacterium]
MIRPVAGGVVLSVRVVPRARRAALGGIRDGALVVRVPAPPVDGAANDALVSFLAETLDIPRSAVAIQRGERGRVKRVAIAGVTAGAVRAALSVPAGR